MCSAGARARLSPRLTRVSPDTRLCQHDTWQVRVLAVSAPPPTPPPGTPPPSSPPPPPAAPPPTCAGDPACLAGAIAGSLGGVCLVLCAALVWRIKWLVQHRRRRQSLRVAAHGAPEDEDGAPHARPPVGASGSETREAWAG